MSCCNSNMFVETGCPVVTLIVYGDRMSRCNSNMSVETGCPVVTLIRLWRQDVLL